MFPFVSYTLIHPLYSVIIFVV
uniref:Uncharacterized protein n=1 Tax=Arundo donax TaxID=35708 RepID=A0A0A9HKG4_ARUDO